MKKIWKILIIINLLINTGFANNVFEYSADPKQIMDSIPEIKNITCKFTQEKTIPNSPAILKSGGNFSFQKEQGVIFETLYPVQITTTYNKNEQINKIISDIARKNYSSLEKNFRFFFKKQDKNWELGLIPTNSQIKQYLKRIYITGDDDIKAIRIDNIDESYTKIIFYKGV